MYAKLGLNCAKLERVVINDGINVCTVCKGIRFHYTDIDSFSIILSVYPTDTCQIVIGCSNNPILLNFEGVNKLAITLCRIEERLSNLCFSSSIHILNYNDWIITLWHIGKDSISEYSGKMFHCAWSLSEKLILRIYSKTIEKKKKIVRITPSARIV